MVEKNAKTVSKNLDLIRVRKIIASYRKYMQVVIKWSRKSVYFLPLVTDHIYKVLVKGFLSRKG